jgi:hypothetical protein
MKNFKTHIYVFPFYFRVKGAVQEKDKSLPLANEEYADNIC